MWRWQLPKQLKELSLGRRLLLASVLGHLFVLVSLLVFYKGTSPYNVVITSTMINTDVPIVFMPLHKSIKNGSRVRASAKKTGACGQREVIKKEKDGVTLLKEPIIKKKKSAPIKNKKQKKGVDKKFNTAQKPVPAKPIKTDPKLEEKIEESKISTPLDPVVSENEAIPDALYVGQQEMEALQVQEYIQNEMIHHWKPPLGMRKDLNSLIKIVIDHAGIIDSVTIETSSGSSLFDSAACVAASKLVPLPVTYGKTLLITFKP